MLFADFVLVRTAKQEAAIVGDMTPRLIYQPGGRYGGYDPEMSPARPDLFNIAGQRDDGRFVLPVRLEGILFGWKEFLPMPG